MLKKSKIKRKKHYKKTIKTLKIHKKNSIILCKKKESKIMRKTRNILRVKSNKNSYKRIDKVIVTLFKKNT